MGMASKVQNSIDKFCFKVLLRSTFLSVAFSLSIPLTLSDAEELSDNAKSINAGGVYILNFLELLQPMSGPDTELCSL